jgi:glycosyltransferase involved in cell wall biosynthesis
MTPPFFSIIIPIFNGGKLLEICLQSVHDSLFTDWELIVVDDASTDDSAVRAEAYSTRVIVMSGRSGPAAARNEGALQANGRYLFFTDSDCQLHPNTLSRAAQYLQSDLTLDSLIGSYDDEPLAGNFVSQYKNLFHHYVHQTSRETATTFWTGCGAIKRERFLELGGFDAQRYPRPAIEDIELGYRLRAANGRIRLAKDVQVKHLKQWYFISLLRSDIRDRALPWARLLQEQSVVSSDLNLQIHHRLSVLALFAAILSTFLAIKQRSLIGLSIFFSLSLILLNYDLYVFFKRKRGWLFAGKAIALHWLYYGYSAAAYLFVYLTH